MCLIDYYRKTADWRDEDGLLTQLPDFEPRESSTTVSPGSNGSGRAKEFVDLIAKRVALAGRFHVPCPTEGCDGEIIYGEGCGKCLSCGYTPC